MRETWNCLTFTPTRIVIWNVLGGTNVFLKLLFSLMVIHPIVFRRAEEVCGCKPWHIPATEGTQTCFILGNICFDQIMSKIETGKMELSCDCEPDCVVSR